MENYFNYFTEIEEHFLRRRGGGLLLSTLDWALIETWKDAGIPLEAVVRGIDTAFDRREERPSRSQKINSLAYCSQAVLTAAEDMKEAAVGSSDQPRASARSAGHGFEPEAVKAFLHRNAELLSAASFSVTGEMLHRNAAETARTLRQLAEETHKPPSLEGLERRLTVLEEKLFAALLASTPDDEIMAVRAEADRDLAPYRRKMSGPQIEQLQKQYVQKRLLEKYGIPRLSLFYMA